MTVTLVKMHWVIMVGLGCVKLAQCQTVQQSDSRYDFFEARIRPVLVQHCYECHSASAGTVKGGLRLDSRAGWQQGGDSGPAIIPGDPNSSHVLLAVNGSGQMSDMPPQNRLPESIVRDIEKWIADGASDPRESEWVPKESQGVDLQAGRQFWSFQPRKSFVSSTSIDQLNPPQFPVAAADQLVRRLYLDLIGMPPSVPERAEFRDLYEKVSPEEAVRQFCDRLLERKEFGEKWARHWLDVVRYADSNGGDFNLTFHESWRYRNYVIDALNEDVPYDQFVREQIAGDLLPTASVAERSSLFSGHRFSDGWSEDADGT